MKRDSGREVSDVKRKFLELQEYLEVLNQLERVPECKLRDALKEEIGLLLNPPEGNKRVALVGRISLNDPSGFDISDNRPSPQYSSKDEFTDEVDDLVPRKKNWLLILLVVGMGLLITIQFLK